MKIIIFSKSTWNILNFRKSLIKRLIDTGYSVYIIASQDSSREKLVSMGCKIYPLKINNKKINPITDFLLFLRILKIYKSINPNLICHFNIKPVIYGSLASGFLKIPNINMITGLGTAFISKNLITKIVKFLYFLSLKNTNMVFFQNTDDKKFFIENNLVNEKLTNLIPGSGVSLRHYEYKEYPKNNDFIFLLVSRILWDKGIMEFVEAASFLKSKYKNIYFQLLGPIENEIESEVSLNQIKIWEKEKLITYLGFVNDVRPYIEKSHCVVLPSYREGTPKSLLEAAAMGRPIIATNTVGCKEVVNDGLNGYLCENKDSRSLARSIEQFIKLPLKQKISMGLEGRKKIEKEFDEKFVINNYLTTIKEIVT